MIPAVPMIFEGSEVIYLPVTKPVKPNIVSLFPISLQETWVAISYRLVWKE